MDRPIFINHVLGLETATLREIYAILRQTYCGHIGVEFMHIQDPAQKAWIQQRMEAQGNHTEFSTAEKRWILDKLTSAESFEQFLNKKYTGTKRFGLDGGESTMPALEEILRRGAEIGLEEVVIGMPHRGRLNVLANFMGKPFTAIFSEFQGGAAHPEDVGGSGDVKYHLGTSSDRSFGANSIHLSLTANPSHLEAVDPVVVGKARAKQDQREDRERKQVMALLMHGDAAFAGQGLVPETLDLSELKGYRIGGTIHFVVNNQIGFTTNPVNSRSGPYCSDVAKIVQAPIFHVNGDDPEAVVHVARIAIEFRQAFNKDVVIDMFCYRRFGHNEGDEPAFTQPRMYKAIAKHPTTRKIYSEKLVAEKVLTAAEAQAVSESWSKRLEDDFEAANSYKVNKADWLEGAWSGLESVQGYDARRGFTEVPISSSSSQPQPLFTCRTLKSGAWLVACSVYLESVASTARSLVMSRCPAEPVNPEKYRRFSATEISTPSSSFSGNRVSNWSKRSLIPPPPLRSMPSIFLEPQYSFSSRTRQSGPWLCR